MGCCRLPAKASHQFQRDRSVLWLQVTPFSMRQLWRTETDLFQLWILLNERSPAAMRGCKLIQNRVFKGIAPNVESYLFPNRVKASRAFRGLKVVLAEKFKDAAIMSDHVKILETRYDILKTWEILNSGNGGFKRIHRFLSNSTRVGSREVWATQDCINLRIQWGLMRTDVIHDMRERSKHSFADENVTKTLKSFDASLCEHSRPRISR